MAIITNEGGSLSTSDIKQTLINTIHRTAEKSVQDGKFDKTILATIQYCADPAQGIYKIKYQNGYFTAYSEDKSVVYSDKAICYVKVQGNDMSNKLMITGLASDNSGNRTLITNLEGDQQFAVQGGNLLTLVKNNQIQLKSYDGDGSNINILSLYNHDSDDNFFNVNDAVVEATIKNNGGYLRIGTACRTQLDDIQKVAESGDYGIIVEIVYNGDNNSEIIRKYQLSTLDMNGNPFEFNDYVPQYKYWEIDAGNFKRINNIYVYCTGFESADPKPDEYDIFFKDISIHSAYKLYDNSNDAYNVKITPVEGSSATFIPDSVTANKIQLKGELTKAGLTIDPGFDGDIQFYWVKEDASVNSPNHPKYCQYAGKGWYCLNNFILRTSDAVDMNSYKNQSNQEAYTCETPYSAYEGKQIEWITTVSETGGANIITLPISMFPGKRTNIQCIVIYENTPYYSTKFTITNETGMELVLLNSQGDTSFYNGQGNATITAGLRDQRNTNKTFDNNISYIWTETNDLGIVKSLPSWELDDILINYPDWDKTQDNEDKSDYEVNIYLNLHELARYCIQRYTYYNQRYSSLLEDDPTKAQICLDRYSAIVTGRQSEIQTFYRNDGPTDRGLYILGPSGVTFNNQGEIDSTTVYDYNTSNYNRYKDFKNTLLHVSAANIYNFATYTITAMIQTNGLPQAIETKTVTLKNVAGSTLNYDLIIDGGDQVFMYDEQGIAPTSRNYNRSAIDLKPLTFRLLDKSGQLIFDSSDLDNETFQTNTTALVPIWTFSKNEYSLLKTTYEGSANCTEDSVNNNQLNLKNEAKFYYDLRDKFEISLRNESNVQLKVYYDGGYITSTTHFAFAKEGNLGTNGTSMFIEIHDTGYELNHMDNGLTADKYCYIEELDGTKSFYKPSMRHLGRTYLYATRTYTDSGVPTTMESGNFVNFKFATSTHADSAGNPDGVNGSSTMEATGFWYSNGVSEPVDSNAEWKLETFNGKYLGTNYSHIPSFTMQNGSYDATGARINTKTSLYNNTNMGYKPIRIPGNPVKVGQNVIKIKGSKIIPEQTDLVTNEQVIRECYGYYQIPYFYYSYYQNDPSNTLISDYLDPATHLVIVGGFDEVLYDSSGANPEYNHTPFKFFLFDKDGNNITKHVLESNTSHIKWECSPGFSVTNIYPTEGVKEYNNLTNNVSLYGTYCIYNNNTYQCIVDHKKNHGTVTVQGRTYSNSEFIRPYWELVNYFDGTHQQTCSFIPNSTYDSIASSTLFNAYVTLTITTLYNGYHYEAQAMLPINVFCNRYGSAEINNWDGKKTVVDDAYIISSKIAAGVKNQDNSFTGVTIGSTFYPSGNKHPEVGIFGYGRPEANASQDEQTWNRTLFIDAHTGRAIFGPSGSTQIVLNPAKDSWSRLAGWYFSNNFLYKPIGEGLEPPQFNALSQGCEIAPPDMEEGSGGLYVPFDKTVSSKDVFLWASAKDKDLDMEDLERELERQRLNLLNTWNIVCDPITKVILNQEDVENLSYDDQGHVYYRKPRKDLYSRFIELLERALQLEDPKTHKEPIDIMYDEKTIIDSEGNIHTDSEGYKVWEENFKDIVTIQQFCTLLEEMWKYTFDPDNLKPFYKRFEGDSKKEIDQCDVELKGIEDDCSAYNIVWGEWHEMKVIASDGAVTTYKDFNNRKENFYVTYGGHLHAESADISGRIVALSGSFGNGSNKVDISIAKDGRRYILYNKNFWVRDGSGGDPEVFMKGTVRASSGQFGKVGNKVDGKSNGTVFIEYSWYPWNLPEDNEPWSKLKLDTSEGTTVKYALYHKNFHIKNNGQVFFKGNMYCQKGRIGDWVITKDVIKDITSSIVLDPPSKSTDSPDRAQIKLGKIMGVDAKGKPIITDYKLKIKGDGSIIGPAWSISADGKANFTNDDNTFNAKTIIIGGGGSAGGYTLNDTDGINFGNTGINKDFVWSHTTEGIHLGGQAKIYGGNAALCISGGLYSRMDFGVGIQNFYFLNSSAKLIIGDTDDGTCLTDDKLIFHKTQYDVNGFTIKNGQAYLNLDDGFGMGPVTIYPDGVTNGLSLNSAGTRIDGVSLNAFLDNMVMDKIRYFVPQMIKWHVYYDGPDHHYVTRVGNPYVDG